MTIYLDEGSLEDDQDGGHVVATETRHGVSGYESFEEVLYHLLVGVLLFDVLSYNIYDALVVLYVVLPYAVAPHQHELISLPPLKLLYVRLTSYHLLVVRQGLPLVVEVPERPRQVEASVDPTHRYLAACLLNPCLFYRVLRLVVFRKGDCFSFPAEDGPRVSRVGDVVVGGGDQEDVGRATDTASDVLFLLRCGGFGPASNFIESLLPVLALDELINPFEGLVQGLLELLVLV